MSGNRAGGLKAAQTIKEYDEDFYKYIGKLGGQAKGKKGFALQDPEKHRAASRKGGMAYRKVQL